MLKDIATRADIELLVNTFYTKVQNDDLLGRIFNDVAKVDWSGHLPLMYDFWESILFGSASYKGNAIVKHIQVNGLEKLSSEHFNRWLQLFTETVDTNFSGINADQAKIRALSIATVIQTKIMNT